VTAKRGALVGAAVLVALLCGCTAGSGAATDTSTQRTTGVFGGVGSTSEDVTVVVRLQVVGPSGPTPADVASAARAVGCVSYQPGPYVPAGPTWVIHLRVRASGLDGAEAALRRVQGLTEVSVGPPGAFLTAPTAAAGGRADAIPC
jgi:hypothetical protein